MEASSSTSTHRRPSLNSQHRDYDSKTSLQPDGYSFEMRDVRNLEEASFTNTSTPSTWQDKVNAHLARKFPELHGKIVRSMLYLRGPRPKIELSDPMPILNIDRHIRGRHIFLPIESTFIRRIRGSTSPLLFFLPFAVYVIALSFMTRANSFLTPSSSYIDCTATYWSANNQCGLNGENCGPYDDTTPFDFRCPAQCDVILQNPRTIGNTQMAFEPLIVGGGDSEGTYRGDSFICSAAIQAGVISRSKGGCASLQIVTNHTDFVGTTANGFRSISFPTIFPVGFRFLDSTSLDHCEDLRNPALAFNVIITVLIFLVIRPKPIIAFWSLVCIGFWHVTLFSQPRGTPPPLDDAFATFLPALFIAYAFWRLAFRFVLPFFLTRAPIEGTVWYLGPYWVGVLLNHTFERIPIGRLTSSDIGKRAGSITALTVIIVVVVILVINQIRVIRKTGWLPYYLGWYVAGGLVALVISQLPGLSLRLHHYILPMILLPGTAFPTRLSAIYQGLLLGMFLNGAAAFDFDSILQTAEDLRQDATLGSDIPQFLTNSSTYNASITFVNQTISWLSPPDGWDGFSLLVDDVERYFGDALNFSLAAFEPSLPHFFRLALKSGDDTGDFTMPATLWPNGTWVDPLDGAT